MANEKKQEKKAQDAAPAPVPQVAAPETQPAPTPTPDVPTTALVPSVPVTGRFGIVAPTIAQLDALDAAAKEKFNAFVSLAGDDTIPAELKTKIQQLIEQANPIKPGMEEVVTTWTVPRLVLCQPTTNDPKKPDSARPGDIFSSTGQLIEKPLALIPLYFNEENIKFKTGEKAPECSAPDAKIGLPYGKCETCPHLPLGKQNGGRGTQKKTECQNQIVVAFVTADLSQVYLVQFGKTSRSAGSALIGLAKGQPFPWKQSYLLSSSKETGDLGVYYIYKIEPTGKDNSPETHKVAKALSELYQANRKKMLGEYYFRASTSEENAAAAEGEFVDDSKLEGANLDPSRKGQEPDLAGAAAQPGPSVRSSAKPM